MAIANLTAQRVRELLHYDPETGVFTGLKKKTGRPGKSGMFGSIDPGGYHRVSIDCKKYWAHRVAFLYMTGEWPKNDVDHIDGNPANNRWANLRDVSTATNVQNVKRASKNNKSGFLGVEATKDGTFYARIMSNRVRVNLGHYSTPEAAHEAYLNAKRRLHEGCTI